MGTRDARGRKLRAVQPKFSDYFFRCHGNGLRGTPRKRWVSFSASGEKFGQKDLVPGEPGTTRGNEFVRQPLSWLKPNAPPSACSTSQCCHPSRFGTYDQPVGSVSVCLKIQRILSKQKQRLLLSIKGFAAQRHEQMTLLACKIIPPL